MLRKIKIISLLGLLLMATTQMMQGQVLLSLIFGDKLNSGKVEFGMNGGFNLSYIRGIQESKGQNNWELGFYFDILLKEKSPWYAANRCLYQIKCWRQKYTIGFCWETVQLIQRFITNLLTPDGTVEKKFNTFYVPLNLRYLSKSGFFIEGGAQIGLVFKTHDVYNAEKNGYELNYDAVEGVQQ